MTRQRESDRQQALMAALLQRDEATAVQALAVPRRAGVARGLDAYRTNAGASAERALAATFPTVQALVGTESFAALARAHWQAQPPRRGDLAWFGEGLPAFIEVSDQLADVPYLADAARLDWLLAAAERAGDVETELDTLTRLSEHDPAGLHIVLSPGVALLSSAFPVVSLWRAHQADGMAHHDAARAALAAGTGEQALVWRSGWRGRAVAIEGPTARWMDALLRGQRLSAALAQAGEGFAFEDWLVQALQQQWLAKVTVAGA